MMLLLSGEDVCAGGMLVIKLSSSQEKVCGEIRAAPTHVSWFKYVR